MPRIHAAMLISVEDIEDDRAKEGEIEFMDAFAARVRAEGIEAAKAPILETLPPIIGAMVREATSAATPPASGRRWPSAPTAPSAASTNSRRSPPRRCSSQG